MAAVPPGPSGALSASPAEVCFFPGDGCVLPAEGETLEWQLKDAVISDTGQERENKQKYLFPEVHTNCQALERQVNGLNCIGLAGLAHSATESEPRAAMELQDCRVRPPDSLHNNNNSSSRLCFPHHDLNTNGDSSIHDRLTLSRTEFSQSHTTETACCPRPEEGAVLTCQTDGPLEQLSRLDLNHSPSRETGRGQEIKYVRYESELQMPGIMRLITKDLSEPYSIYTYRYFIHNWPQLCFLAVVDEECVGAIVCKLDMHKKMFRRGYIAMLAVDSKHRRKSIGTNLVKKAIYAMVEGDCDEVVLETEITNKSALKLYENLGFVRDKRLFRYYLNGVDALRLKLWLR
ncbi:N-alpha-acetyltransferase 30-like [Salminus brasiliensis]|uniref:N-alpha-acetyltransferase 30-like n=1 Tax=Salminus brasiliensis TaxID=930266 RepID=UPI003B8354D3